MEGGRIDELMSHILNSEVEEEAFMAGLVGELEVPTLVAPRSRVRLLCDAMTLRHVSCSDLCPRLGLTALY